MFYTANPCADAERHFDAIFDAGEAHDAAQAARATALADDFVSAAEWGADEPLAKSDVAEALYEVSSSRPELIDAFFYRAATQASDPVLRAMVQQVADAWAEIKIKEAA